MHIAPAAVARAAATPTPTPSQVDPALVTPGPWGFVVIAFIALAVIFLIWDMMRRIRRGRVRADIMAELDAEQQASAAARATEVDDETTDAAGDDQGSARRQP
jgi:hypothetical protein